MTSPLHPHPDRSSWIQQFVWTRLNSLLPAWKPALAHEHTDLFVVCKHTLTVLKHSKSEMCSGMIKGGFSVPVDMMTGSIQASKVPNCPTKQHENCQVGW